MWILNFEQCEGAYPIFFFFFFFGNEKYIFQRLQTIETYLKIPFINGRVHVDKGVKLFSTVP